MLGAVVIALPLGGSVGVALHRCPAGGLLGAVRRAGIAALLSAVALPLYLHAAGWEAAAGKFGWIPLLQTTASRYWFVGSLATIWIHGVSGAAWVALGTAWGLARLPRPLLEMAALEAGRGAALRAVALPLALPVIAASGLWVALLAATEMTVADLYGVRSLADLVYLRYAYDPEPLAIVLACLAPALVAIPLLLLLVRLTHHRVVLRGGGADPGDAERTDANDRGGPLRRAGAAGTVALGVLLILGIPLSSLLVKAGWGIQAVSPGGAHGSPIPRWGWSGGRFLETLKEAWQTFGAEYGWTALLAVATAAVAVLLGGMAAGWADGSPRRTRLGLIAAVLLVLLPGPVVGLGMIELFHGHGAWLSWLYRATLVPTIFSQLVRAVPAAYLVVRAGYRMLDPAWGDAALADGVGRWGRLWRIEWPLLRGTVGGAAVVAALVTIADVPASLVVLPPSVTTVGTRLFGLLHSGVRYQESGLAIGFCVGFAMLLAMLAMLRGFRPRIPVRWPM